jgi:aminoglycoside phosphotransferase family enzyme
MSWLFMTGRRVFKLKKPILLPFLDFTTVSARHDHCVIELMLNRRLAGPVYRRVVPLSLDAGGLLTLTGQGEVVDWLIEMKQLPADRMLDACIRAQTVEIPDVMAVATRLAEFYTRAHPRRSGGGTYVEHIWHECRVARDLLMRAEFGLNPLRTRDTICRVERLIDRWTPEIRARIGDGVIVEGHGDLKPEHVCLTRPPLIFDCLEFDARMLLIDPYDEVGYLGLECERLGAGWIKPLMLGVLQDVFGYRPDPRLIQTYAAFRALLRARMMIGHLADADARSTERWAHEARAYLAIAEQQCCMAEG